MTDPDPNADEEPTVECTLTEAGRERREQWVRAELLPRLERVEERETDGQDGAERFDLVFEGTDETLGIVAEAVRRESTCCAFADYEIRVEPPYDETRLLIAAPDGADDLFREGVVEAFDEVSLA